MGNETYDVVGKTDTKEECAKELEENILMQLELVGLKTLEGVMWNLAQLDIGVNLRM